ncbi:MAG: hypothetical protein GY817_00480 [bacterium]|nr:hypothetical protein [bacterium]
MKKLLLIFFICISMLGAQDYVVTNIIKIPHSDFDNVRIILNNFLVIENIKVYKEGVVQFPYYHSKKGSRFPYIEILDSQVEQNILIAIKTNQAKDFYSLTEPSFEIKNIQLWKGSKRKANVEVMLDSKIVIFCGVMAGKNGDWIAWPASKKFDNKYHKDIYLLNSSLKEKIETAIFKNIFE